jgi:hypothetical protein
MAIRYHYDLYPRTDPRDGTRIRRFTKLQRAMYRDVIGVGSGAADIRSTDTEAADLDPLGEQYVRIVREDTTAETELVVAGFWINRFNHDTAVARETKRLTFSGAGHLAYLARARMWSHTYMGAAGAGAGITTGAQDPFDDIWRLWNQGDWAGGDYLGAVFWRVIMEAQSYRSGVYTHRHKDGLTYTDQHSDDRTGGSAISLITLGFDKDEDSDGNPWSVPSGEFQASVGENVLTVTQRLMQAGLYVELDPDTFELRAWENDEHRRDRTGGAWGASVVRFQAPTDSTVATGNMLSDSEREINSHLKRTVVLAGGQDSYAKATAAGDIRWEGFEASTAADSDALTQLASTQITAREEAADAGSIRMKLGTTPLSGRYRPWEEVRLDDLVTVHTGSSEWDYDEATYPVAGLKIELQKSGAWWAWAELGASFSLGADRRFQIAPTAPHTHPPNPELCRPGTIQTASRLYMNQTAATPVAADAAWEDSSNMVTKAMSLTPSGTAPGTSGTTWDAVNQAAADFALMQGRITLSNAGLLAAIQAGGPFRAQFRIGIRHGIGVNEGAQQQYLEGCIRVYRPGTASFVGTALAVGAATGTVLALQDTAGTIANRSMVGTLSAVPGAVATDVLVVELGTKHTGPTTGAAGARFYWNDDAASDLPEDDFTTTNLRTWIDIGATGVTGGDIPLDTVHQGDEAVGTSVRAARCDHEHAHGYLSADGVHYHDADQIDGIISGGGETSLLWYNVRDYGAAGDGATDDQSAINDAIAALVTAGSGVLYFPAGNYLTSGALDPITVPCTVRGDGASGVDAETAYVSRVTCSSSTAVLFDVQSHAVAFENLALVCSAATPSAGAGIAVTAGGDHGQFRDISVKGFYIDIDVQEGAEWRMEGCYLMGPALYGLKIRHVDLPDGGDVAISDTQFIADDRDSTAAIWQESGGGLKITNVKINARPDGGGQFNFTDGIHVAIATGINTSIVAIANTSIENVTGDAIDISTVGTATFSQVVVDGVQVGLYGNNSGRAVKVTAAAAGGHAVAGGISGVSIDGLMAITTGTARAAVELTNTDVATLGEITLLGFNARYTGSGDTNTSDGGGGVSDLDDLGDVIITAPAEDDTLRYDGSVWVNDNRRWEAVTNGTDVFVWEGSDLVHEWKEY